MVGEKKKKPDAGARSLNKIRMIATRELKKIDALAVGRPPSKRAMRDGRDKPLLDRDEMNALATIAKILIDVDKIEGYDLTNLNPDERREFGRLIKKMKAKVG